MDASKMRPGTPPAPGSDYYAQQATATPGGAASGRVRPDGAPAMVAVLMFGALGALIALRAGFRGFVITI